MIEDSSVTQEKVPPSADDSMQWIDIGHDHAIAFVEFEGDQRAAIRYRHKRPDGSPCEGHITPTGSAWDKAFNGVLDTWDVQSWEPLTCSPSLLCRLCGDHGHIQGGKWVRA